MSPAQAYDVQDMMFAVNMGCNVLQHDGLTMHGTADKITFLLPIVKV